MTTLSQNLSALIESFDYSGSVEERIRILRAAIGTLGNIFYGTEREEIYSDQVRRIKLRLRELRGKLEGEMPFEVWKELMDNLEELRDEIERIAVKEGVLTK
jgi:hypothetical protein